MPFKFEQLIVWQLSLEYIDRIYQVVDYLPKQEEYNLKAQMVRAATSIALNIAEGSTAQTDPEQVRFLGYSLRSLMETIACIHLIRRRQYMDWNRLGELYQAGEVLAAKLHTMRKSLRNQQSGSRKVNHSSG